MTTYKAIFTLEDGNWNVEVPEIPGCVTWGRDLATAQLNAIEAIAALAAADGKDPEAAVRDTSIEVVLQEPDLSDALENIREARAQLADALSALEAAGERAQQLERAAVQRCLTAKLTTSDVATLLGMAPAQVRAYVRTGRAVVKGVLSGPVLERRSVADRIAQLAADRLGAPARGRRDSG